MMICYCLFIAFMYCGKLLWIVETAFSKSVFNLYIKQKKVNQV